MEKIKIYSYLFIVFLLSSCELSKEIDYETIYEGDKIVIHGFINTLDGVNLIVKKTVSPDNVTANDKLNEINIVLYEDCKKVQSLIAINEYLYSTPTKFVPKLGSYYYIEAVSQGLPKVFSLPQPIFSPVEIDSLYLVIDNLTYYANLIVSFNNNPKLGASYYLKVQYFHDGVIDSSRVGSEIFNPFGLIDNTVNGLNTIEEQVGRISEFDSLRVELYTLSPDLTKFLQSFKKYDSSVEDPFFEQTYPVFTNIENGYGIFASYSYTTRIIQK
jgi:hypothetical protein